METKTTNSGFTLIELLVVIAIIGLLAGVILLALNSARAKARDAKRAGDTRQMVTALEQYHIAHGVYPTGTASVASVGTGTTIDDPLAMNGSEEVFTPDYVPFLPVAPEPADGTCLDVPGRGNNNYWYDVADDGSSYTLTYCLGGLTGQLSPGTHFVTPNGTQ